MKRTSLMSGGLSGKGCPRGSAAPGGDALLTDWHVGATYTVSGPDAISQLDQARLIGGATSLGF